MPGQVLTGNREHGLFGTSTFSTIVLRPDPSTHLHLPLYLNPRFSEKDHFFNVFRNVNRKALTPKWD